MLSSKTLIKLILKTYVKLPIKLKKKDIPGQAMTSVAT